MRDEITLPLLDCGDIARTFGESREAYMRWKGTLTSKARDPEVLLDHENAKDTILTPMFNAHRTALGDAALKACRESVRLRRIVRRSVFTQRETWPEESWHPIAHLLTSRELCLAGILEYITTGEGRKENVDILARWGFQYALDTYYDAGYYGQNSTRLEDIPK